MKNLLFKSRFLVLIGILILTFGCGSSTPSTGDDQNDDDKIEDCQGADCSSSDQDDSAPNPDQGDPEPDPADDEPDPDPDPQDDDPEPDPDPEPEPESDGDLLGNFEWTYYWIEYESNYSGPQDTPIYYWEDHSKIADARADFYDRVKVEGTGYLEDGRMIGLYGDCPLDDSIKCFSVTNTVLYPYGTGWNQVAEVSTALQPFRTVAADQDVVAPGKELYVPALVGKVMPGPNGFTHDGCVTVEDTGVSGVHLDFFSELESYYIIIDTLLGDVDSVDVYENSPKCP